MTAPTSPVKETTDTNPKTTRRGVTRSSSIRSGRKTSTYHRNENPKKTTVEKTTEKTQKIADEQLEKLGDQ